MFCHVEQPPLQASRSTLMRRDSAGQGSEASREEPATGSWCCGEPDLEQERGLCVWQGSVSVFCERAGLSQPHWGKSEEGSGEAMLLGRSSLA